MIDFSSEPNKLSFLMRHRFGVNYVPSRNWYYCYNNWNADDIRHDFESIAALGADHMRVMVIWPWFQPNPAYVSREHLDHLEQMLEIASGFHLDILFTLYTGWLSGYRFNPHYLENEPFFTSPQWTKVQDLYLDEVARRVGHHVNFLGFDIGNEINCDWQAPTADGDAWMVRIFNRMQARCPDRVHVNGVDHQPWFTVNTFSPQALMTLQQIVALHAWPYWCGANRFGGPLDDPYTRLPAGMTVLARSYGNDPVKPVWLEEFGACSLEMLEADVPRWLEKTMVNAIEQGVSWFTWWASHDIDQRYEFHPFEYHLGLVTTDQKIKPQGLMFKQFADAYRGKKVTIPTIPLQSPPEDLSDARTWQWLLDWMR